MTKRPIKLTPIGGVLMCIGFSAGAIFGFAGSMLSIERTAVGIRADLSISRSIERIDQDLLSKQRDFIVGLLDERHKDDLRITKLEKLVRQLR